MYILIVLFLFIVWIIPPFVLSLITKKLVKRKYYKFMFVPLFFLSALASWLIIFLFINNTFKPGFLFYAAIIAVEKAILTDEQKTISSYETEPHKKRRPTGLKFFILHLVKMFTDKNSAIEEKSNINRKNNRNKNPHEYMINIINYHNELYDSVPFYQMSERMKKHIIKNQNNIDKNLIYYDSDNKVNIKSVKQMTIQILIKNIDMELTSGNYHIYRGVLNDEGKKLLKIYKNIIKELISLEMKDEDTQKLIDEDWVNRNIKSLIDDIKTIG